MISISGVSLISHTLSACNKDSKLAKFLEGLNKLAQTALAGVFIWGTGKSLLSSACQ
jgi:hypothetical protein